MIRYKKDILKELKNCGYNTNKIRQEKIIGQSQLQQIRQNELVSWAVIDKICTILQCDIGDILEFIPNSNQNDIIQ